MRRFLVGSFVALAFLTVASPAFAHHPSISAQAACADGTHVVDIVVSNGAKKPMTIDSLTASIDGTSYPVGGFVPVVDPEGMTGATSDIPGEVVGTVTVSASVSWPDGFAKSVSTTVELEGPCTVTTTTAETTTSTVPPSTAVVSTVPCDQTPACLPNTGSDSVPLTIVGLGAVGTGALLAAGFRLTRRRSA